jgi:hypothetical protein
MLNIILVYLIILIIYLTYIMLLDKFENNKAVLFLFRDWQIFSNI